VTFTVNPLIGAAVFASTAATDAAYVFFNAAVVARRRVWAAHWSAIWYMLSAFRSHQLHRKCDVRPVCRGGFMDWRIRVRDLVAARLLPGQDSHATIGEAQIGPAQRRMQ
jgi:hypothetical protein